MWTYSKQDRFHQYDRDHYDYADFVRIVTAFRCFYGLTKFSFKEVDKFLFLTGAYLKGTWTFAALEERKNP